MHHLNNSNGAFSVFSETIKNTIPQDNIKLQDVYDYIISEEPKDNTLKLRAISDKDEAQKFKAESFGYATFSGSFKERKESEIIAYSNFICIDIDKTANPQEVKQHIITHQKIKPALVFISPSGKGVKAVYRVSSKPESHKQAYEYIANTLESTLEIIVDRATSSIASACYLSWDPDAYFDSDADQVILPEGDMLTPVKTTTLFSSVKDEQEVDKVAAIVDYIEDERINMADDYHVWVELGYSLASLGESSRELYHRLSKQSAKYEKTRCDKQFDACLKSTRDEITLGTFYYLCNVHDIPCGKILRSFSPTMNIIFKTEPYWDIEKLDQHKERVVKLSQNSTDPLVKKFLDTYSLEAEALINLNIGLDTFEVEPGVTKSCLILPHLEGEHVVYFNDVDELVLKGIGTSNYYDTFFGTQSTINDDEVIIFSTPLEAIIAANRTKKSVLSLIDNGNATLSPNQLTYLEGEGRNWKKVYICKAAISERQKKECRQYVRSYADTLPWNCDVYWVNPATTSLTDPEISSADIETLLKTSEYIWNSITERNRFWVVTDDKKPKLQIDEIALSRVLNKAGFKKIYLEGSDEPILVKVENNIIEYVSEHQLMDFIRDGIVDRLSKYVAISSKGLETRYNLSAIFLKYREKILSKSSLAILKRGYLNTLKDHRDYSYFFFKNTAVKISKEKITEVPYKRLPACIWKEQIIDRVYSLPQDDADQSDFEKFVSKVAGEDPNKIQSYHTTLGYLLHTFKDKTLTKAVILTDSEYTIGKAEGGTGKSLFAESISYMRKQHYIAAKNIKVSDKFAFMGVKRGDQNLFFDDARSDFDFESLFNVITNDMQVEEKYRNRFRIPFEESPKILIATNSVINGQGNSFDRRQHILEFSPYFMKIKPEKEFGKRLYHDWNQAEWSSFDHFMIICLQKYLKEGLRGHASLSYPKRKLIENTAQGFVEWAEKFLEPGVDYSLNVLFDGCDKATGGLISKPKDSKSGEFPSFRTYDSSELLENQIKTFNIWLEQYASYKHWKLKSWKRNGYTFFVFGSK